MPAHAPHYDARRAARYRSGAPHLRHRDLRELYSSLAATASAFAGGAPRVLDLGAGDGGATVPFLELGARVTAVDDSAEQLARLRAREGDRLEILVADAVAAVDDLHPEYDVIVASSFLHHVPDYAGFLERALRLARPRAAFLSFQDPLLYATLMPWTRRYGLAAYGVWRLTQGDVLGGLRRRLRRRRGEFREDVVEDVIEYHATRAGVDAEAVLRVVRSHGFDARLVRYFSTQSAAFHAVGRRLGLENTFAVIATRDAPPA